jgi:ankyrin repeat protein
MNSLYNAAAMKARGMVVVCALLCALVDGQARADEKKGRAALHDAAIAGKADEVKKLLKGGAGASPLDDGGDTPLHVAKNGAVVKALLAGGARVDQRDVHGVTPLAYAIGDGRVDAATALLAAGADPNAVDNSRQTPLFRAHDSASVLLLLGHGADATLADKDQLTPIQWAAKWGDTVVLASLLEGNVRADTRASFLAPRPIVFSCGRGDLEIVKLLVMKKASLDALYLDDPAPIVAAVQSGNVELVRWMAKKGVDVKAFDVQEPLLAFADSPAMVKALVDLGAKNGLADSEGGVLLQAAEGRSAEVIEALLAAGARGDTHDSFGATPLLLSLRRTDKPKSGKTPFDVLLAAGLDPEATDERGHTAIMDAVGFAGVEAVKALIAAHAKLDVVDANGWTLMHYAAYRDEPELIELLAKAGVPIDAADFSGQTPLHVAAARGRAKSVTALAAAGAKLDARDLTGATPLHLAAFSSRLSRVDAQQEDPTVKALLEAGADPDLRTDRTTIITVTNPSISASATDFVGGQTADQLTTSAVIREQIVAARKARMK